MIKASLCWVALLFSLITFDVRGENIEFIPVTYDFGLIEEDGGICHAEFTLANHSSRKVRIKEIKVACGCTNVEYPKKAINPGGSAILKVSYDPFERPGKFEKEIYVYLEGEESPYILRIKGRVMASAATLALFFPYAQGDVCFETLKADFGEMPKGVKRREFIDIYNSGSHPVRPRFDTKENAISLHIEPEEIGPGETGTLIIYLDSSRVMFTGERTMEIRYIDNEKELPIQVRALLIPPVEHKIKEFE